MGSKQYFCYLTETIKMKNSFKFLLTLLSIVFVLGACSKYEEGPAISLLTKKARITGDWKPEKIISSSGKVEYYNGVSRMLRIMKNDNFEEHVDNSIERKGTWSFTKDKEYFSITYQEEGITFIEEYKIIRLKNKELWMEDVHGEQINYVPS